MVLKTLSIKDFVGNIVTVVNDNFKAVGELITKHFSGNGDFSADNINVDGKISSTTISTKNLIIRNGGSEININDVLSRLAECERKISEIESQL